MDLVEEGAQRHQGELLMVEPAKNLFEAPWRRALGQMVG
jgi:hypothetical protein